MNHDVWVLLIMTALGAILGAGYDILRAMRRAITFGIAAVWVTDLFYWLGVTLTTAYTLMMINDGILRAFEFCGMIIGAVLYFLILSKGVITVLSAIFEKILKIFYFIFKILLTPVRFLYKILLRVKVFYLRKLPLQQKSRRNICKDEKSGKTGQ